MPSGHTIFLASGFVAKYPEGGGNFSVVLQWALGLKKLKTNFVWLELLASTGNPERDQQNIRTFIRRLRAYGLDKNFCLIALEAHDVKKPDLSRAQFFGMTRRQFKERLAGPNTLLNLSSTVDAPLVTQFERRIFCSLDPSEICFWMTRMEVGQSYHHAFYTIGLNIEDPSIPLRKHVPITVAWKTFLPLVDTGFYLPAPRPTKPCFTTVGQWYWDGCLEVNGQYPDFSKKAAMEKYFPLARKFPHVRFELAVFLNETDPESARIASMGWRRPHPEYVVRTPKRYARYIARSLAEFTPVKLEAFMQTGWLSDRAAVYLAMGRPVVTESTGAEKYLPNESGFLFVRNLAEAEEAVKKVLLDWENLSKQARTVACDLFEASKTLKKMLD